MTFDVGNYDSARPLVIDPLVLGYSTFLGGSGAGGEHGYAIDVDDAGHAYVAGWTTSPNFPVTAGAFDTTFGGYDAFVAKLNPQGSGLEFATYLGGSGTECSSGNNFTGLELDVAGDIYLACATSSFNFPITDGAYDSTFDDGGTDMFVTKLSADGSQLIYSTYVGGSATERSSSLAIDVLGNAYITGYSNSIDYPTTPGAYDPTPDSSFSTFLTKLNADGTALDYSTSTNGNLGEDRSFVAVDSGGNAYVAGGKVRVLKFNAAGSALVYNVSLGMNNEAGGIALDGVGNAYVTGVTFGNVPITPGAFDTTFNGARDAFVTKINAAGNFVLYGTYFGGSGNDYGTGIELDAAKNVYLTGYTFSNDLPITSNTYDATNNGMEDVFVAKLELEIGTGLIYSTYIGGPEGDRGYAIAVDSDGRAYVTGYALAGFPTTQGALKRRMRGNWDAFVTKLVET